MKRFRPSEFRTIAAFKKTVNGACGIFGKNQTRAAHDLRIIHHLQQVLMGFFIPTGEQAFFPDGTKKGPEGFLTGRLQVSGIKGGDSGDLAGFPVYIYGINPFRMIRIPADNGTVFLHLRDEPGRFLFGESDYLRQVCSGVRHQVDFDRVRKSRHGQHNGQQERKYIFIPAFHMIPP